MTLVLFKRNLARASPGNRSSMKSLWPLVLLVAALSPRLPAAEWPAPQSVSVSTHDSRVRYRSVVVDGLRIFYREAGDPKSPAILLLHGFSSSSHMFRELMPLLAENFYVVAPDYPGFGYSDAPAANVFEPSFANLERVVEQFTVKLGLKPFTLYMQDFGGPVGFRMAVKHPEWISGLIIQNANAYLEGLAPPQRSGAESGAAADGKTIPTSARVVNPEFIRYLYRNGARDASGLDPDAWTLDIAVLQNPEARRIQAALIDDYKTNIQQYSIWQAYMRKWQPKTLIAWGKNDAAFLPIGAEAFRRDLPDVDLQFFDTGHFALEEDAGGIALAIRRVFAPAH
jgi:pimeloyl-ACP methyl ester carboxylesterase